MPRISTHVWETLMPRRTARIGPITAFDLLRSDGWLPILGWELSRGTTVAESDHQPGDDRDLAGWTLSRLGRSLVFGAMAARKASAGGRAVGRPRFLFPLGEGFRRRPEHQKPEILPFYQRGTDYSHDRDRDPGGGQAILTGANRQQRAPGLLAESQPIFYI